MNMPQIRNPRGGQHRAVNKAGTAPAIRVSSLVGSRDRRSVFGAAVGVGSGAKSCYFRNVAMRRRCAPRRMQSS
jgi:hypothetical protein